MEEITNSTTINQKRLFQIAFAIAIFTVVYNILEGLISVYFGLVDESLTLFGFGVDSFIEVISGVGIAMMVARIQSNAWTTQSKFEQTALRVTGFSFYLLFAGLIITSAYNIWISHRPETTFWGIVISIISICVMSILVYGKRNIGKQLNSEAILADANCTMVCIYMSVILLVSSLIYSLTKFLYVDVIGALGLAYFCFKEGKECFDKAKGKQCCSHC